MEKASQQSPPPTIARAYQALNQELKPDTILLVDGGTDLLMRGDEASLGTPYEDIGSLNAIHALPGIPRKMVLSIGFGVEKFHGVCHALFLENVAALIKAGGYLGCFSLTQEMPEYRQYVEAYKHAEKSALHHPSIVNTSINSAVEGEFGNYHATPRTTGSHLFINPLMSLYWAFNLEHVARNNYYLSQVAFCETLLDFTLTVNMVRTLLPAIRKWREIEASFIHRMEMNCLIMTVY